MAWVREIVGFWRAPRRAIAARLAGGPREDQALAMVLGASALIFLAQMPGLARDAVLDPSIPLDARLGGALLASMFLLPLLLYLIAGASHLLLRAFGATSSGFGTRLALFWSLLAVTPLMLVQGLLVGLFGHAGWMTPLGAMVLAGFLLLWGAALRQVGFPEQKRQG